MHVAFGRVRRKSRIVADDADDADYRMGGGRRLGELSEAGFMGFVGFSGLGIGNRRFDGEPAGACLLLLIFL